jgi:hypothetical protein
LIISAFSPLTKVTHRHRLGDRFDDFNKSTHHRWQRGFSPMDDGDWKRPRDATEVYFCFSGGGATPTQSVDIVAGSCVIHRPGESREYANGAQRTLLFRVRYGANMHARHYEWRGQSTWKPSPHDAEYFRRHHPF